MFAPPGSFLSVASPWQSLDLLILLQYNGVLNRCKETSTGTRAKQISFRNANFLEAYPFRSLDLQSSTSRILA